MDVAGTSSSSSKADTIKEVKTSKQTCPLNFLLYVEASEKRLQQDNHKARMLKLRKEQNYLKETEWQYDPIEKHIGQS